jgi:hypothetical protein
MDCRVQAVVLFLDKQQSFPSWEMPPKCQPAQLAKERSTIDRSNRLGLWVILIFDAYVFELIHRINDIAGSAYRATNAAPLTLGLD